MQLEKFDQASTILKVYKLLNTWILAIDWNFFDCIIKIVRIKSSIICKKQIVKFYGKNR